MKAFLKHQQCCVFPSICCFISGTVAAYKDKPHFQQLTAKSLK